MTGYGTIYRFEFDATCKPFSDQALNVTKCKVLILKKAYTGAITDIPHVQVSPVVIDYPTADDDVFYPLKGSTLSFMVLGGAINMDSLISEDENEYFLEYYRDDVLFWSGFVSPELCEEDIFLKYPAIEFKTIDGLGTLKDKDLTLNQKYPKGINSLLNILQTALNLIGYNYPLNVLCKTFNLNISKTDYSTPLEQTYVYTAGLQDKNFNFKDNLDIIVNICNTFNSIIYQNYGNWYFVKPKDLAFGVNEASIFSTSGVLNTSSKKAIPTLNHGTDFLIIAEPKRSIRRFYKQVEIEYQRGDSKFINGNFNLWTGTVTEIPYTSTLDLNVGTPTETDFKDFLKSFLGTPKSYCLYDSTFNRYFLGLTSSNAGQGALISQKSVSVNWGEGFTFSVKTITSNPSFSLAVTIPLVLGNQTFWYNFDTGQWQNSEYIYTSADYPDGVSELPVFTFDFPFPEALVDYDVYKFKDYKVGFNLYAAPRSGFTGNQTIYEQVLLNGNGNYYNGIFGTPPLTGTKQSESYIDRYILTNPKLSTIIPDKKVVYFGDKQEPLNGNLYWSDDNYSHLHYLYSGDYFPTVVKTWYERNEYDPSYPNDGVYGINELNARNILNQYSDYRNIFKGTIIGKNLQYGAIYQFPVQGALADKKFWPLSMRINERDCTADVVFIELSPNEITAQMTLERFDTNNNLVSSSISESKKKIVMG